MAIETSEAARPGREAAPRERSLGEHVFLWLAWALAAAFWGGAMTAFFGILHDAALPSPAPVAGGVGSGAAYFVGGIVVLGVAIATGAYMTARRDRRMDPVTEAATARLYDAIERQGGADLDPRLPPR